MVMPEIGFAEEPIWPQMREDTGAKKNPKITIRTAPSRLTPSCGSNVRTMARAIEPPTVSERGRSSSVRSRVTACPSRDERSSLQLAVTHVPDQLPRGEAERLGEARSHQFDRRGEHQVGEAPPGEQVAGDARAGNVAPPRELRGAVRREERPLRLSGIPPQRSAEPDHARQAESAERPRRPRLGQARGAPPHAGFDG